MGRNNRCYICGGYKSPQFFTCIKCTKKYDLYNKRVSEWPVWIKEMVKFERSASRRQRLYDDNVTLIDPYILEQIIDKMYRREL